MDKLVLDQTSLTILNKRYLRKDEHGNLIETPSEMWRRVARAIAAVESEYDATEEEIKELEDRFYEIMSDGDFCPNSPTLFNAGKRNGMLSACFVLPVEDNMESIFDAVKDSSLIQKAGGGTGFSFSRLRPSSDVVSSTKGVSSGPISFMKVFDAATDVVKQGGSRRGACMGILNVSHPNIVEFINCKKEEGSFKNFNISVAISDHFMKCVEDDLEWNFINPRNGQECGSIPARKLFDMIVDSAWNNGEPGVVFIDTINNSNPLISLGRIEATNPCGEQPLLPHESCNLGSINLSNFVSNGTVDWNRLKQVVELSVCFLDNVIDANHYPLPAIEEKTVANRKIGLGVMGWADMLVKLGIPYNSEQAVSLAKNLMERITDMASKKSSEIAEKKGCFENWDKSIYFEINQMNYDNSTYDIPMRNATLTTIAPTGTISTIMGCSSGIEPYFSLAYDRHILDRTFTIVNPFFEQVAKERGFYSEEMIEEVKRKGSLKDIEGIPEDVKAVFLTTFDVDYEWHIKMQAAFQLYTHNAVSKTINFPNEATRDDVYNAYLTAFKSGCKGITVYRDGSRLEQVLTLGKGAEEKSVVMSANGFMPRPRPDVLVGVTPKVTTACGNLYVTMNSDEQGLCEVFAQLGKSGDCIKTFLEWGGRIISTAIRAGVSPKEIANMSLGLICPKPCWYEGKQILSCPDAIGRLIVEHLDLEVEREEIGQGEVCPECGKKMQSDSGCWRCLDCGYSKCN